MIEATDRSVSDSARSNVPGKSMSEMSADFCTVGFTAKTPVIQTILVTTQDYSKREITSVALKFDFVLEQNG